MSITILCAGRDVHVMEARSKALTAAGFNVVCSHGDEFMEKLFEGNFDAIILCHSLREEERRRLAGIIKSYHQATPVVVVSDLQGRKFQYGTRTVWNYPEEIIASLRELTRSRGRPQVA